MSQLNTTEKTTEKTTGTTTEKTTDTPTVPSPNNDFYHYVNQAWLSDPKNAIPADYSSWGGFTKLHDETLLLQIKLVKDLETKPNRTVEESKIYAIWKASTELFDSWDKGLGDYSSIKEEFRILEKHFAIDTTNTVDQKNDTYTTNLANYLHYTQINGIKNVLDFDTGSDLQNVNNVVLDFSIGGLSLPSSEYYYKPEFADKLVLYREHLKNIEQLVNSQGLTVSKEFVNDIIDFETAVAKFSMTPAQSRNYDQYYTTTTLENLYLQINTLRSLSTKQDNYPVEERDFQLSPDWIEHAQNFLETLYTRFDFRTILAQNTQRNFPEGGSLKPPAKEQLTAYDGDAIRRCFRFILDPLNFSKYYSYMQYRLICSCSSFCTQELDAIFFDFHQRKLGGQEHQKPNDKRSIARVNGYSGEMLGKIFVDKYFPPESKKNIQTMITEVLSVMNQSLLQNNWLTAPTQQTAVEKLACFRTKIGYPDVWKDYSKFEVVVGDSLFQISKKAKKWSLATNFFQKINSVLDREEWGMTPQTVNAYFMPTQNEIVFPAGILQPPFYHQTMDTVDFEIASELKDLGALLPTDSSPTLGAEILRKALNYGGIGAVIAHEITHGYDDNGRKFDCDGNLNDWWTSADTELFTKKTNRMIESVAKYAYTDPSSKITHVMNPKLTMGENLADIGGLSLSIKALLNYVKSLDLAVDIETPCLRVFFKSWANIWKRNIKPEKRALLLSIDPHGPTDFRGNLVQHMSQFYQVYNVVKGDKMYLEPAERMEMW